MENSVIIDSPSCRWKFQSQWNLSGASQQHSVLLNNWSTWGLVLKINKTTDKNNLAGVIQVYGSPKIQNWFEKMFLLPF